MAPAIPGESLYPRARGPGRGYAVSSTHFLELHCARHHLHLLEHVSGIGKYAAIAVEFMYPIGDLCGSCNLAIGSAGLPNRICLVPIHCDGDIAGAGQRGLAPCGISTTPVVV